MTKLAVDITIIPSKYMQMQIYQWNAELVSRGCELVFGDNAIPHITLAQGVVKEEDLLEIDSLLGRITHESELEILVADGLSRGMFSQAVWLTIENTQELDRLHRRVMREIYPHLSYDATREMFADPKVVNEKTVRLGGLFRYASFDHFKLHITLGFGKMKEPALPVPFEADKLAMYQLGNHCTCASELVVYDL